MIPVFSPCYDQRELDAVTKVFSSGWTGLGAVTQEFEDKFSEYMNVKHSIALNSCTSALHLALCLLDIKSNDEVIVPTVTFVSTAHAVMYMGASPIFCDINPNTFCLDWNDVIKKVTDKTKAIIPVCYGGQPVEDPPKCLNHIPLIYDCAHACGANIDVSDKLCCWSFHSVKNLSTGDGGMLTTPNDEYAALARRMRWLGIDKSTWQRTDKNSRYWWNYDIKEIGFKYHMNDITSALGISQLSKLPEMQKRRKEMYELYKISLDEKFPIITGDNKSSLHLLVIKTDRRDDLSEYLKTKGISTGVHYKPLHLYPCYKSNVSLVNAEKEWLKILTLPFYPTLNDDDIKYICSSINDWE